MGDSSDRAYRSSGTLYTATAGTGSRSFSRRRAGTPPSDFPAVTDKGTGFHKSAWSIPETLFAFKTWAGWSYSLKPMSGSLFDRERASSLVALSMALALLGAAVLAKDDPAVRETPSPELQLALDDSANGRFPAAKKKLAAILSSASSSPKDRDEAGAELARIEWRIDDKPDDARRRLEALIPNAQKPVPAILILSRMERSLGRYDAARAASRRAVSAATTSVMRENAALSLALSLVGDAVLAAREGLPIAYEAESRKRLTEALGLVGPAVSEIPGPLTACLVQLDAALLLDDGPHALEAWRSYYTAAGAADSALLAGPRAVLSGLLPRWRGPLASREDRAALVKALADSRLFPEAVFLAKDPRVPESARVGELPWVEDLVLYESYARDLHERTDRYYRTYAQGKEDSKAWKKDVESRTEALWKGLAWPGTAPSFDGRLLEGKPDTALGERFGTVMKVGKTGDVWNLHMGHRVVDDERAADQYGRHAKIRFIALDSIVSNGYETWLWDGSAAHGGWGDVGLIVQVRPEYAEGAVREWQALMDPERRATADKRLAEETARDEERAAKDPFAYLPGVTMRLRRAGIQQVLDAVQARGVEESSRRAAFVAEFDRALIGSSIFAHEGRHAIDAQFEKPLISETLEYRAKLSEIAFAPLPRLAFGGILNVSIGNKTPHGQANLKLVKGFASWMAAHGDEIAGLDRKRPLLLQLDKLTEEQLRSAARSLDPMAAGATPPPLERRGASGGT